MRSNHLPSCLPVQRQLHKRSCGTLGRLFRVQVVSQPAAEARGLPPQHMLIDSYSAVSGSLVEKYRLP